MSNLMKRVSMVLLGLGLLALGACNTTAGVGEDISSLGDGISDVANDAKGDD